MKVTLTVGHVFLVLRRVTAMAPEVERIHIWIYGCMDARMDGRMDGWTDGPMEGYIIIVIIIIYIYMII